MCCLLLLFSIVLWNCFGAIDGTYVDACVPSDYILLKCISNSDNKLLLFKKKLKVIFKNHLTLVRILVKINVVLLIAWFLSPYCRNQYHLEDFKGSRRQPWDKRICLSTKIHQFEMLLSGGIHKPQFSILKLTSSFPFRT